MKFDRRQHARIVHIVGDSVARATFPGMCAALEARIDKFSPENSDLMFCCNEIQQTCLTFTFSFLWEFRCVIAVSLIL